MANENSLLGDVARYLAETYAPVEEEEDEVLKARRGMVDATRDRNIVGAISEELRVVDQRAEKIS